MCDEKKNWDRPLYPKEIAENASNWSFAADLGLLKYLEVFSEVNCCTFIFKILIYYCRIC